MTVDQELAERKKKRVALSSVAAAIVLTLLKLVIGLSTNSLGILSEAAHSGLDLVAAVVTYFAVKIAGKPADEDHNFGHGKAENLSALFETILLLITCGWIIYEVIERLSGRHVVIEVTFWSFFVVIFSIIVDISRSTALKRTAKKYNSQALEADALHFTSDIFSSGVVLIGLICYAFGITYADSIAALIVSIIVIFISIKLGKRSIDVLLDSAPRGIKEKVLEISRTIPEVLYVHDIKVRNSGPETLIDLNIHLNQQLTLEKAHEISHYVEQKICENVSMCKVMVHIEPDDIKETSIS